MEAIWQFLSTPDNREVITWLGSGIAAIAAALWVIIKFFSKKGAGPSPHPTNQTITADRGGVASGRDTHIGVKGLSLLLILLFFLAVSTVLASNFGKRITDVIIGDDAPIPEVSLALSCGREDEGSPNALKDGEFAQLNKFTELASEMPDQTIYFSVDIELPCAACGCPRADIGMDDREITDTDLENGSVYFDSRTTEERRNLWADTYSSTPPMWIEGLEVTAFGGVNNDWATTHYYFLPKYKHLNAQQYRKSGYGMFMVYDGLFALRYYFGTGADVVYLDPIEPTVEEKLKLACIRNSRSPTFMNKLRYGC
jgi:hypothetical protein